MAENRKFVPAMAAQHNFGVWLPDWAGAAPWKHATGSFARRTSGSTTTPDDACNVLTDRISDSPAKDGHPLR